MVATVKKLHCFLIAFFMIVGVCSSARAETPEETASRIAKEEQAAADADKREAERKAEEKHKLDEAAAKKGKDRKEAAAAQRKAKEKEDARIVSLQSKCEKNGGDWKRGKCMEPQPPKPAPKIKVNPYVQTAGVDKFLSFSNELKGVSFETDSRFESYCQEYAALGVRQAYRRINEGCASFIRLFDNDAASQWDISAEPQRNWCLTVSSFATEKETLYRERMLRDCIRSQ